MNQLHSFFLILFAVCTILEAGTVNDYQLSIEQIDFPEDPGQVHFFLNNSYEFFGPYDEGDVIRLNPGTPVEISAHPFYKDVYRLWTYSRDPTSKTVTYYLVFMSPKTLEKLPKITEIFENKNDPQKPIYEILLDDGSKWNQPSPKFANYWQLWKEGNQVVVSKMNENNTYWLVNVDAPHRFENDHGRYIETRNCKFSRVDERFSERKQHD